MSPEIAPGSGHLKSESDALVPEVMKAALTVDTVGRRFHVEWDPLAPVTPLGQLVFFCQFLGTSGLYADWVAQCPLRYESPNAPAVRDVLGTATLAILSGACRYAHVTALRGDQVNPRGLGMEKVVSEDSLRRAFKEMDAVAALNWQTQALQATYGPALEQPWIADLDVTIKPIYGHQEGAEVGYNPHKPGRPSHCYHTYWLSNLRLVLRVDALAGDQHNVAHATAGLWQLLDHLGAEHRPFLLRGDKSWGIEAVMARAEQQSLPYLFRLRMTKNVRRALDRAMATSHWADAGKGWQGKETSLRLEGWSRQRRVLLLRRKLPRQQGVDHGDPAQRRLGFIEIGPDQEAWEYAALVTSLDDEILTVGQLYRDRADCENAFDELKNQWGWGGFTTQDLTRCRLLAGTVALIY